MQWTTERPAAAGYYWATLDADAVSPLCGAPEVVYLDFLGGDWYILRPGDERDFDPRIVLRWAGPVPLPGE